MQPELEQFIPCLFPFFFVGMWVFVTYLVALIGGWKRLAAHYQSNSDFLGQQWSFSSGRLGVSNYSAALTVGANSSGLYLAVLLPWRPGHPPLFIPWQEINTSTSKSLWGAYVNFTFSRAPDVTLRLRKNLAEKLLAYNYHLPGSDSPQ
jgi:hypothetical protein